MSHTPPSFKSQDKNSQSNANTQALRKPDTVDVKHLTASLFLRIIQAHYGLSTTELAQTYPNSINDVSVALQDLAVGRNGQRVRHNTNRLFDELVKQTKVR